MMSHSRHPRSLSSRQKPQPLLEADTTRKDKWSILLDSVASGKQLPEKRLLVLGGSSTTQKDLLEILNPDAPRLTADRPSKKPPVANDFALGYTYQEVLDADHEDSLARLSIFTLQDSLHSFSSLLQPLLTPETIPETLLVILLDWSQPWQWIRQIRDWIRLLHDALSPLDDSCKTAMQEVMQDWEQRRRGGSHDFGGAAANIDTNTSVPLGPGEWDEPLGLPLCVVCHNSDQIEVLEMENGWSDEDFDFVLQFLRTVLLKHGASIIYTSNSMPNSLPLLVQCSLGIHSILNRKSLKHNVVDRDKILIPPNWDSWGKIRILRDSFNVEGISESWGLEIQPLQKKTENDAGSDLSDGKLQDDSKTLSALEEYESSIRNPNSTKPRTELASVTNDVEVETIGMQEFLAGQADAMDRLKSEEERAAKDTVNDGISKTPGVSPESDPIMENVSRVKEHVGPIQFNMGGIQVDAEDMLNRIKERSGKEGGSTSPQKPKEIEQSPSADGQGKPRQEALANFFAGLIKKSGGANNPGAATSRE